MFNGAIHDRMQIVSSYLAWKKIYILSKVSVNWGKKKKDLTDVNSFYQIVQTNYSLPLKKCKGQKANM